MGAESGWNRSPGQDRPSPSPSQPDGSSREKRRRVLVAEDNRADAFLIREALARAALEVELEIVQDGEKAIRIFEEAERDPLAPCPSLVILDLNLPKRHGREVLQRIRQSRRCANAVVLVVTSSDLQRDRDEMRSLGAQGYFCKPSKFEEFMKLGELAKGLLAETPEDNVPE